MEESVVLLQAVAGVAPSSFGPAAFKNVSSRSCVETQYYVFSLLKPCILLKSSEGSAATSLAVKAVSTLDPIAFCGDEHVALEDLVTMHVVLGGVTSAISSRVLEGVLLLTAKSSLHSSLRSWCLTTAGNMIVIDGGVVALAGDLALADVSCNYSVQVVFIHGEIGVQTIDASAATQDAPLCIPVSSYKSLRQLAEISGAEIIDSWDELLPSAIGREHLELKVLDISATKVQEDDDDYEEVESFFLQVMLSNVEHQPHVSIVVQGPIRSLASELRNDTRKMICRLRNVLRSGYVLPGNGGFWCACAAAVAQQAEVLAKSDQELLSFATARLADPLLELSVVLLENVGSGSLNTTESESFFSRLAKVQMVQKRFERGVQDVGASKFFSRYYNFRSAGYAVLPPTTTEPDNEDGRVFHVDEYKSMGSAIRGAFRVVQLLLNTNRHHIN
ncbi:unnamed protein product [Phytophthora fragariaefolia]|uniref:Unnamed protein product n=1 Tax=Phytophthora fragariaefolia TaxID=1490495 RepID=A0A9W7D058_9STRA|nr:unnamed protein product [Phytophthora fragariaefolia]